MARDHPTFSHVSEPPERLNCLSWLTYAQLYSSFRSGDQGRVVAQTVLRRDVVKRLTQLQCIRSSTQVKERQHSPGGIVGGMRPIQCTDPFSLLKAF